MNIGVFAQNLPVSETYCALHKCRAATYRGRHRIALLIMRRGVGFHGKVLLR